MTTPMLERVSKLLNQAENAGTPEEAATFMEKAQQLATVHSIDLARARHATIAKQRTKPVQRTVHIGSRGQRGLRTLVDLYLGIAHANDARCTISHDATTVYAVGYAEDLDVAEALFASLQVQMAKEVEAFKAAGTWRGETYWDPNADEGWGALKPVTWLTARLNFQEAFAQRVGRRLAEAKRDEEARQEREESERQARPHLDEDGNLTDGFVEWFADRHGLDLMADDPTALELTEQVKLIRREKVGGVIATMMPDATDEWVGDLLLEYFQEVDSDDAGMALVLVEKRSSVADEYRATIGRRARGTYRGGTSGARSAQGRSAGRAAGDRARLGASTPIGGTKGALGA